MTRISSDHTRTLGLLALATAACIAAPLRAQDTRHSSAGSAIERARQEQPSTTARISAAKAKIRTQDTPRPDAERARQQAERQQAADKERVERARRAAQQANRTDPGVRSASQAPRVPAQRAVARTTEERREIAKHAAHFESQYRDRVARVNRLIGIYKAKGDDARVVQLERMREHLDVRRENAMAGFRKDLGETDFKRFEGQVNSPDRRGERERTGGERAENESQKEKPPGKSGGGR